MVAINGFLVSADRDVVGVRTFRVPGTAVPLPVRADVAPLLIGLATQFHRRVEPLHEGWCWGYAYRPVRGSTRPSFHAAGLAIDLNAPAHPLGVPAAQTLSPAQIGTCRALARTYGCRWGGDYRIRPDAMHFEVILPREQALALVARLQAAPPKVSPYEPYRRQDGPIGDRTLRRGAAGDDVAFLQRWLGVRPADGLFGPATDEAVRRYQQMRGLTVDGIAGPATWRSIADV